MLKLSDNPPITSAAMNGDSVFACVGRSQAAPTWSVAHTRPRQEKSLAGDLLALGTPFFLPMVQRVTVSGGRRRRGMYPLFPSYVFFEESPANRAAVLRTNRTVQVISPSEAEQPRFLEELQTLERALLVSPDKIELYPRVVDGARVRIGSGAMRGVEVIVVRADNSAKIWLQVTALGTGALVEIDADLLDPIG